VKARLSAASCSRARRWSLPSGSRRLETGHHINPGIKIVISLACYRPTFWSSYVAFEKIAGSITAFRSRPISSKTRRGQRRPIRNAHLAGVNALIVKTPVDSRNRSRLRDEASSTSVFSVGPFAPTKGKVYMIVRPTTSLHGIGRDARTSAARQWPRVIPRCSRATSRPITVSPAKTSSHLHEGEVPNLKSCSTRPIGNSDGG